MKALTERLQSQLGARKSCIVFETDLQRIWPREKYRVTERKKQIEAFAEANGLEVTIWDSGLRAMFKKKKKSAKSQ